MRTLSAVVVAAALLAAGAHVAAASCAGDAEFSRVNCFYTGARDTARAAQCDALYNHALSLCQAGNGG